MKKQKIVFSERATNSFRRIVTTVQKSSLIGGEDTREALLRAIKKLTQNPYKQTERLELVSGNDTYRLLKVWSYSVVFHIQDDQLVILDLMIDRDSRATKV